MESVAALPLEQLTVCYYHTHFIDGEGGLGDTHPVPKATHSAPLQSSLALTAQGQGWWEHQEASFPFWGEWGREGEIICTISGS